MEADARAHVRWPALLAAVLGFAAVRIVGLLAVYASPDRAGRPLLDLLSSYDGDWYLGIAQHGYDLGPVPTGDDTFSQSNLAFFPLLPGLVRLGMLGGLAPVTAGVVVAAVAGLVAAAGIYRLGEVLHGPRTGVLLALCWAMLPYAVVGSMVYTEALFTATAAWALVALVRRRWLTAALWCVPAGLARPTAAALIGTVGLVAIVAIVRRGTDGRRGDGWRPWAAAVIAPAGLVGYWWWVGDRLGRPDGWLWVQGVGWGSHFDGGLEAVREVYLGIARPAHPGYVVTSVTALVVVLLTVTLAFDRTASLPVVVFAAAFVVLVVGTAGSYHSKGRLLLPEFVALLPVAKALAGARTVPAVLWLAGFAMTSVAFGSYLLTVWAYSP